MPSVSEKQHRAMEAAAHGHSTLGIPKKVGEEFVRADAAAEPTFETPPEDATDHEVAEGIRDGKYASPQKYGDFWLFDLRITGTGMAWRDSIEEWAHRDPETWLTDEFVQRCNGLPVIFGHPDRSGLNSEEFAERAIGTIVLPYIKGDEVWGVAKIFNADAAEVMQTTHRSTSPGVTPPKGSTPLLLEQGTEDLDLGTETAAPSSVTKVLDEGLPLILDHLAVCEAGVWDKDGPPDGIRLDALIRKDLTVAEKTKEEVEREDAQRRADAMELDAFRKADKARKDAAEEEERKDKARKDAEESDKEAIAAAEKEKADKAKKDAADKKKDSRKDRHAKHDGDIMDCARCDSEEAEEEKEREDKAKKDAAAAAKTPVDADRGNELHDSVTAMQALIKRQGEQLAALTAQPSIEDSNEIAKAWSRWDSLYQSLGDQTPQAYPGEKPRAYLRRLADGVRKYTDSWKSYAFHDSQQVADFGLVADAIFAEAQAHSRKPSTGVPGVMREIVTHPYGKTQTEFIGDSRVAFAAFMPPRKSVVLSIRNPHTGNVYGN